MDCPEEKLKRKKKKSRKNGNDKRFQNNLSSSRFASSGSFFGSACSCTCCSSTSSFCSQWQHLQSVDYIKNFFVFKRFVWRFCEKKPGKKILQSKNFFVAGKKFGEPQKILKQNPHQGATGFFWLCSRRYACSGCEIPFSCKQGQSGC